MSSNRRALCLRRAATRVLCRISAQKFSEVSIIVYLLHRDTTERTFENVCLRRTSGRSSSSSETQVSSSTCLAMGAASPAQSSAAKLAEPITSGSGTLL